MRICYFAGSKNGVPRNKTILRGLKLNNVEVTEIYFSPFRSKYLTLLKNIFKSVKIRSDAIIVGYDRWLEVILSKLTLKTPVFWDPLYSQYDANVFDRKVVSINSLKAKLLYYREFLTIRNADCVLLDTDTHIEYFKKLFHIKDKKYERVFVSADDSIAFPQKIANNLDKFIVIFIGSYIPLHGIEYIIEAANELRNEKNILFKLVGKGQTFERIRKLKEHLKLSNIEFIPPVPYPKVIDLLNFADVCLGIFGMTRKAGNVIPSKVYDALATAKPIITGDSFAIREILNNEVNCILCERGNGKAIAKAILQLKEDANLRKKIAKNGYLLFKNRLSPKQIGKSLVRNIRKYL